MEAEEFKRYTKKVWGDEAQEWFFDDLLERFPCNDCIVKMVCKITLQWHWHDCYLFTDWFRKVAKRRAKIKYGESWKEFFKLGLLLVLQSSIVASISLYF